MIQLSVGLLIATLLGGCDSKKDKPASQVAAKVNKEEISVHQINYVLQQQRGLKPEQVDAASRQILEQLITQEIAVQKAVDAKLARDPKVLQALDAARREVLARAYVERQADGVARPTPEDVDKYFADKPALFTKRRVYTLAEFVVQAPPEALTGLDAALKTPKGAQGFADALKARGLPFQISTAPRTAESLPSDLLDKVAVLTDGQGLLIPQNGGARALVVVSTVSAPVTLDQSRPAIEQFLLNDARRKKMAAEVKALRTGATIEYVGKFAAAAASAPPPDAPSPVASEPAMPTAAPAVPAAAELPASQIMPAALDSGVKGLK